MESRYEYSKKCREPSLVCVLEEPENIYEIGSFIKSVSAFKFNILCVVSKSCYNWKGDEKLTKLTQGLNRKVKIKSFISTMNCIRYLGKNKYASMIASSQRLTQRVYPLETTNFKQYRRLAIWFSHKFTDAIVLNSLGTITVDDIDIGAKSAVVMHWIKSESEKS